MESSTTIVADVRAAVAPLHDDYDKLAGYEAFRRIKDDFAEPARPSLHDVESVASVLSAAVGLVHSQNKYEVRTYEPVESLRPLSLVASQLDGMAGLQNHTAEGRTFRLALSPGTIRRRTFDAARLEATEQRQTEARLKKLAGGWLGIPFALPDEEKTVGAEIREWSAKSRIRMSETVGSLDYSGWTREQGTLAMVTLTLPANWEILCPDGASFKKLVEKFRRRWVRATGTAWRLLWKLEFQRRGAPHFHALMRVPVFVKGSIFTEWLSETWADAVGASRDVDGLDKHGRETSEYLRNLGAGTRVDFSGKDFSDPRRISMYFLGHSAKTTDGKEYQHKVPEAWQEKGKGPGRFWGYSGLDKAVVEIDVTERQAALLDRQLRKIKRARDWKMNVLREQGTAKRTGKPVPVVHEVGYPKPRVSIGITANRTRNRRAAAVHALGYTDVAPVVGIGPVWRVSNLVLVPPAVGIGPDNLVLPPWVPQRRSRYASFSGGQGGFVLVNDALRLGLDLARYLGPAAAPRVLGISERAQTYFAENSRRSSCP